eukprot:366371-Chlamydomonas_euryale.AAC.8
MQHHPHVLSQPPCSAVVPATRTASPSLSSQTPLALAASASHARPARRAAPAGARREVCAALRCLALDTRCAPMRGSAQTGGVEEVAPSASADTLRGVHGQGGHAARRLSKPANTRQHDVIKSSLNHFGGRAGECTATSDSVAARALPRLPVPHLALCAHSALPCVSLPSSPLARWLRRAGRGAPHLNLSTSRAESSAGFATPIRGAWGFERTTRAAAGPGRLGCYEGCWGPPWPNLCRPRSLSTPSPPTKLLLAVTGCCTRGGGESRHLKEIAAPSCSAAASTGEPSSVPLLRGVRTSGMEGAGAVAAGREARAGKILAPRASSGWQRNARPRMRAHEGAKGHMLSRGAGAGVRTGAEGRGGGARGGQPWRAAVGRCGPAWHRTGKSPQGIDANGGCTRLGFGGCPCRGLEEWQRGRGYLSAGLLQAGRRSEECDEGILAVFYIGSNTSFCIEEGACKKRPIGLHLDLQDRFGPCVLQEVCRGGGGVLSSRGMDTHVRYETVPTQSEDRGRVLAEKTGGTGRSNGLMKGRLQPCPS